MTLLYVLIFKKFGNAAGVPALADALGVYYMKQGDYNSAIRAFGDSKSNNAALAQILTKDYNCKGKMQHACRGASTTAPAYPEAICRK